MKIQKIPTSDELRPGWHQDIEYPWHDGAEWVEGDHPRAPEGTQQGGEFIGKGAITSASAEGKQREAKAAQAEQKAKAKESVGKVKKPAKPKLPAPAPGNWGQKDAYNVARGSGATETKIRTLTGFTQRGTPENREYAKQLINMLGGELSEAEQREPQSEQGEYFHGTSEEYYQTIKSQGLQFAAQKTRREGEGEKKGFYQGAYGESIYMASSRQEAMQWASRAAQRSKSKPIILVIRIPPEEMANMKHDPFLGPSAHRIEKEIPPEWITEKIDLRDAAPNTSGVYYAVVTLPDQDENGDDEDVDYPDDEDIDHQ